MNLELLEEIHTLQDEGKSDSDIASFLGMQKNTLIICLRMEKIISNKYEKIVESNVKLNSEKESYLHEIKSLKNDLSRKNDETNLLKSTTNHDYIKEIDFLKNELETERDYILELETYRERFENIPYFIKKWF